MDYPEFLFFYFFIFYNWTIQNLTKEVGRKLLYWHSLGLQICNSVPQKLSKLLTNFQFPSKPPNSKPSLILPIPFPEAKFHGIPLNSKTINGRFAVGFKRLQCSDRLHRSLHGSADPWPWYLLQYLPRYSLLSLSNDAV